MKFIRDLFVKIKMKNHFDFVVRVFQLKLKKLIRNFIEKHVLNQMKTYIYVIKFQKKVISCLYTVH